MSEPKGSAPAGGAAGPPEDLLELLVCPLGKAPLRLEDTRLVCTRCGLSFGIDDGIPNMLVEDAELPAGVEKIEDLACSSEAS